MYQSNACIWDPGNQYHKNRHYVNTAWHNIKRKMGIDCTVTDLKKKKESLMAAYRHYIIKIKKSERLNPDDIYQPTWFAFPIIDSFMGSVYSYKLTEDPEVCLKIPTIILAYDKNSMHY